LIGGICLEDHAEGVGADRQMRTVFFEHPDRQDEHGAVAIELVDARPRQLFEAMHGRILRVGRQQREGTDDDGSEGARHGNPPASGERR
jgi:hypothetical protein